MNLTPANRAFLWPNRPNKSKTSFYAAQLDVPDHWLDSAKLITRDSTAYLLRAARSRKSLRKGLFPHVYVIIDANLCIIPQHKHTPGPWTAHVNFAFDRGQVDPKYPHWCEVTAEGLAPDGHTLSISGHMGIGNARLVAAAPDMLAALTAIAENPECYAALARAAIAKATGQP